ncbi:MAG TPA: DNA repair protein RecO, partial [Pseudobdellovibrionaceae bacterium]|nr:DNA repair protein RecO [Pseudobdellovibrionaceae bacterium]
EGDLHSPFLFNLLGNTLTALEKVEDLELLKLHFYLKLLYQQGVVLSEKWMSEFLKTSLQESSSLKKIFELHQNKLPLIEKQVKNYLHSAELGASGL